MTPISALLWPVDRLGDALLSFLPSMEAPARAPSISTAAAADSAAIGTWVEMTAQRLGLEAIPFDTDYADLRAALAASGPAVLRIRVGGDTKFLVRMARKGKRMLLLGPDHAVRSVASDDVRTAIAQPFEAAISSEIDDLLQSSDWLTRDHAVRSSLLAARLQRTRIETGWLVRVHPRGPLRQRIRQLQLRGTLALFLLAQVASHVAWICAWLAVGADALLGRLDTGRLLGAGLLLVIFAACSVAADHLNSKLTLRLGVLLRQRLLEGALSLDAQQARGEGIGRFLGRIYESQAVEALSIGGGLAAATGAMELIAALIILIVPAATLLLPALLVVCTGLCAVLYVRNSSRRRQWTIVRRDLTQQLIEGMLGHRTLLAQSNDAIWREEQDRRLSAYLDASRRVDSTTWAMSLLPRVWLVVAGVALVWALLAATSTQLLALMIAGILLGFEAFRHLAQGLPQIAGALIALDEMKPLLEAAANPAQEGDPSLAESGSRQAAGSAIPLIEAQRLVVRAPSAGRALLDRASLSVRNGDRILLEGPSGGGKSTLASLLAGLRKPDQGVLLLGGLDLATLGESAWRRRISLAAQFHENHLVSETLAFNLLMGRRWPATQGDLTEAEEVCRELGLGELLDRMPAGLHQMVGESGWQLSHGEKSRIFIARALLQNADLVILDESLAALDPMTLQVTMQCVLHRAPALVVVAHP